MLNDDSQYNLANNSIFLNNSSLIFWNADNQGISGQGIEIIKNVVDTTEAFVKGIVIGRNMK